MKDDIEGLRELDFALGELPKATARNTLRRTGLAVLQPFVAKWRSLAPVDADPESTPNRAPGTYRDSIRTGTRLNKAQGKNVKREGKSFAEVYAGSTDSRVGVQSEFGNAHQSPQPAARPAWDAEGPQIPAAVGRQLFTEIEKAAARLARKAARGG